VSDLEVIRALKMKREIWFSEDHYISDVNKTALRSASGARFPELTDRFRVSHL
jgi:hypothetical protein